MKTVNEQWKKLEAKINALSLRERGMAFAICALLLVTVVNTLLLDPLLARQKRIVQVANQNQQQISAMQAEIQARIKANDIDPDAGNRQRLEELRQKSERLKASLVDLQQGLVSPDRMASLLEDLLRRNGSLQLVSLRTLPVSPLTEPVATNKVAAEKVPSPAAANQSKPDAAAVATEQVYKHGVELVVQGSYGDLANYLSQLEKMPWQLFWAKARLNVDEHPKASLTLTLFTLSLDPAWLHI